MYHTWYFGDLPEDHYQVDSEREDMGKLNMIMKNIVNITCGTFFKLPSHREYKFAYLRITTRWTAGGGTWGSST